ncbi:MAG: glycerol-3-phosphate acyltransferase [Firmicutes bacterium]|nr:glycerol-3-phosphate acyltransferase [Bacillota bacterium]
MPNWYFFVLTIVLSYLVGNWSNALFISKIKGIDLRSQGSGNPGTMNMLRVFGKKLGILNFVLDAAKGALPTLLAWILFDHFFKGYYGKNMGAIAGLSVVVGHIYPVLLGFRGGKGIASTVGVLLVLCPIVTAVAFVVGFVFLAVTTLGSVTSFVVITAPILVQSYIEYTNGKILIPLLLACIFFLTLFAHRSNIKKLFLDTERPVVLFKKQAK